MRMSGPISLLLVDDHALVRTALEDRLGREADLTIVGTAGTADEALGTALELRPDVILMDIDMPGLACFDAARRIRERCPETRIIFLSAYSYDRYVEQALAVRAAGYVTKNDPMGVLVKAIRTVAGGGSCFSPSIQARLVIDEKTARLSPQRKSRVSTLTPRELEILRYIARGMSRKDIAQTVGLSDKTVHRHTINLMQKLDIHDRVELARLAIREGLAMA